MLVIGLTGGIGSGKSTVAQLFAERGVPIVDADVIAREITQPNTPAWTKIIHYFGKTILLENNALDRTKLRHLIFNDPDQRLWLENLLHPLIRKEIEQRINEMTAPYCIAVIPLLIEVKPYAFINRILVVDVPHALQIERVAIRDKSEKSHIDAILKTQISRQQRLAHADDIITNDGTLTDLIPQVETLHQRYLALSK